MNDSVETFGAASDLLLGIDTLDAATAKKVRSMVKGNAFAKTLTREQLMFFALAEEHFGVAVATALKNGSARLQDDQIYSRRQVTGSGNILDASNVKGYGTTNIQGNLIQKGTAFLATGFSLAIASHVTSGDPGVAGNKYGQLAANCDAAILNGEIEFRVNDKPVLAMPVNNFFITDQAAGLGPIALMKEYVVKLRNLRPISDTDQLIVFLNTAAGVTLANTSGWYVEAKIHGISTKNK